MATTSNLYRLNKVKVCPTCHQTGKPILLSFAQNMTQPENSSVRVKCPNKDCNFEWTILSFGNELDIDAPNT